VSETPEQRFVRVFCARKKELRQAAKMTLADIARAI
jgi:hypothetical protein